MVGSAVHDHIIIAAPHLADGACVHAPVWAGYKRDFESLCIHKVPQTGTAESSDGLDHLRTQIDKITIIGGSDGSNGVDQVAGNVPAVMTKLFETMKETVGIDLAEVVKAGTYDAKVNRNITINADGAKQAAEVLKQETAAEASAEIAE